MSDSPSLQDLLEVQRHFGLPSPALVEKDWHVVRALAAIGLADTGPFGLVFGGGTALGRAHGLLRRMSEDIDLKIVSDGPPPRPALRRLREAITAQLLTAGFVFDPANEEHRKSNYEGRYTLYRLPYAPSAAGEGVLRPEIKIETAAWPLRRAPVLRPVRSFIAEAFGRPAEVPEIACAAIVETAAEKFVALTRRAGAEFAGLRAKRDPTLVCHVYDLWMIRAHCDPDDLAGLTREIMRADAEAYGDQFPAYRVDPLGETLRAVAQIIADPEFGKRYEMFRREMIYGDAPPFATAATALHALAHEVNQGSV